MLVDLILEGVEQAAIQLFYLFLPAAPRHDRFKGQTTLRASRPDVVVDDDLYGNSIRNLITVFLFSFASTNLRRSTMNSIPASRGIVK